MSVRHPTRDSDSAQTAHKTSLVHPVFVILLPLSVHRIFLTKRIEVVLLPACIQATWGFLQQDVARPFPIVLDLFNFRFSKAPPGFGGAFAGKATASALAEREG